MRRFHVKLAPIIAERKFNQFRRPHIPQTPVIRRQHPRLHEQIAACEILPLRLQVGGENVVSQLRLQIQRQVAPPNAAPAPGAPPSSCPSDRRSRPAAFCRPACIVRETLTSKDNDRCRRRAPARSLPGKSSTPIARFRAGRGSQSARESTKAARIAVVAHQ